MADYFTRLVERALGTASMVQPIVAPMFAPGPLRVDAERPQPSGRWEPDSETPKISPSRESPKLLQLETAFTAENRRAGASETTHVGDGSEWRRRSFETGARSKPMTENPRSLEPLLVPPPALAEQVLQAYRTGGEEGVDREPKRNFHLETAPSPWRRTDELPPQPTRYAAAVSAIEPKMRAHLGRQAEPETTHAASEEAMPTPTIKITIGRIEVRAIASPAQVQKRAETPAPRLTLADYLKQRGGGGR